jgi:hypothetical protein
MSSKNKVAADEPRNPLAEVFGFPTSNKSKRALHYQSNRLCQFNNVVPSCTKVSVVDERSSLQFCFALLRWTYHFSESDND